jgi:hypothetical protein
MSKVNSMSTRSCFYVLIVIVLLSATSVCFAENDATGARSLHAGFLYPNGVDVVGYTVEKRIGSDFYGFYTFGFPSLAAAGLSYYSNYVGSGLSGTIGVGIGFVLYGSLVYQWKITEMHYLKTGAGYATGIAYTGVYPALSYEYRF